MAGHILCSPGSSGLSLALARHLLQHTERPLFATARSKLDATKHTILDGLDVDPARVTMLELDYKNEASVEAAARTMRKTLGKEGFLRLALITPGVLIKPEKAPDQIEYEAALETFKINTLGPMLAIKHFSDLLPKRGASCEATLGLPDKLAVFATMTARVGSIGDNKLGGWFAYRASKAASNQLSKTLQNNLQMTKRPAISITLHPGTVKTHLSRDFWASTKKERLFSPEFSAGKLHSVIQNLTMQDGGRQFDWKGAQIPY